MFAGCANPDVSRPTFRTQPCPHQHQLVLIPAGSYQVGSLGHRQNPRRTVRLKSYRISDTETTNEQFARFVHATHFVTDAEQRGYGKVSLEGMLDWVWNDVKGAYWRHPFGPDGPNARDLPHHPVTQISGADAEAYCRWVGGRLPTLDEWEVAARAGSLTRLPWGDKFDPLAAGFYLKIADAERRMARSMSAVRLREAPIGSRFLDADHGRCSSFDRSSSGPAKSVVLVRSLGHHNGPHCNSAHAG